MGVIKLWALAALILCSTTSLAEVYHVGPTQNYNDLNAIPWQHLQAGDTVKIYPREHPYRTKIGISAIGTNESPITIMGVIDENGNKPVISAENAVTPESLHGFFNEKWDESNALILIKRNRQMKWGEKPSHIVIENLTLTGAHISNTYTNQSGMVVNYAQSSAAIWANLVDNLTVRNCDIESSGNGLFVLSKNSEEDVSRNIVIEGNVFRNNGVANSYRQHNIYTQAANVTIQFNRFDQLTTYSQGAAIKDRSSNTVIRYNKIFAGTYAVDLVDPEDSYEILTKEPNFHKTWLYGNIIISAANLNDKPFASRLIHYGGDTGVFDIYRKGTLYFFSNTIYLDIYANHETLPRRWRTTLFIMDTNDESIEAANNIIYSNGDTNLSWLAGFGHLNLVEKNWVNRAIAIHADNTDFTGTIQIEDLLHSTNQDIFKNKELFNFTLNASADARNQLSMQQYRKYPEHAIYFQYDDNELMVPRKRVGDLHDLGALESNEDDLPVLPPSDTYKDSPLVDWPQATWGEFKKQHNGIRKIYPAHQQKSDKRFVISIEFDEPTSFSWTTNREIKAYDEEHNLVGAIDLEPGHHLEGQQVISIPMSDLGMNKTGVYNITVDEGFTKLTNHPWKNARVDFGEWTIAVSFSD